MWIEHVTMSGEGIVTTEWQWIEAGAATLLWALLQSRGLTEV